MRLDKALVEVAPEFSRSHLQSLIERGLVALDGVVQATASRKVRIGQQLDVTLAPTDESRAFRPEPMALPIVHEDDDLLVVDKPVGLVVHPAPGHWAGTLLNGLLAHHALASTLPRAGIVHRLDKDTSGLMVVAKTLPAMTALQRQIAARSVRRAYLAIAQGHPRDDRWSIDAPIGRDPVSRVRMAVRGDGREARTDVEVLARSRDADGLPLSAWHCRLHTGRTHQIRVHAAHAGHALVGDAPYGGRAALGMTRQALHAAHLALDHPRLGHRVHWYAPPPDDFAAAWRALGAPAADGAAEPAAAAILRR